MTVTFLRAIWNGNLKDIYILLSAEAFRSLLDYFSFTATHYKAKTSSTLRPCYVKISNVVWNSETSRSEILV